MTRQVNQKTIDLVKEFEGYETKLANGDCLAYLDTLPSPGLWSPGYHGLWTIGWGSTGIGVTQGVRWTEAQAEKALAQQINRKAAEVEAYLTYPVNDNQFGALVSLAYNIGTAGIHGILNFVNTGNLDAAARSFVNYNHAGGVVVSGLTRRRLAERELFEWETKQEVKKLSPPLQDADTVQNTAVVSGFSLAGLWSYLPQVKDFMADHNGVMLLLAVGAVYGVTELYKWRMHQAFNNGTYVPVGTKVSPEVPVVEIEEVPTDANPA